MDRKQMIEALVNQIDDWDLESLILWAMEVRRDLLEQYSDEELERAYKFEVLGE